MLKCLQNEVYHVKKIVNGKYVEMTDDEIATYKKEQVRANAEERQRPLSAEEVTAMLITAQINTLSVDDNTALRMKGFYPTFASTVGQTVRAGFKFTHGDKLWKVIQPELVLQSHYLPGTGTESLYTEVCETHAGTLDDPIPYSGNMELEEGKYYLQEYEIYLCTRSTGTAVYHPLSELVGLYVEKV